MDGTQDIWLLVAVLLSALQVVSEHFVIPNYSMPTDSADAAGSQERPGQGGGGGSTHAEVGYPLGIVLECNAAHCVRCARSHYAGGCHAITYRARYIATCLLISSGALGAGEGAEAADVKPPVAETNGKGGSLPTSPRGQPAGGTVDIKRETEGSLRSSSLAANSTDSAATKTGFIDWASIKVDNRP